MVNYKDHYNGYTVSYIDGELQGSLQ